MTHSLRFKIQRQIVSPELFIGQYLLKDEFFIKKLHELKCRFALITDSQIAPLFGHALEGFLTLHGIDIHLFTFPAGEQSKTRETKQALEDQLISHQFGRDTAIIALGGGVVTDLTGFLASTYCRGVPLILIPTTLLGMVDAGIGGKTAVNTPQSKNFIGTIYYPHLIFSDVSLISSLPLAEIRNGTAEMIKHGLIASAPLFHELENSVDLWTARDSDFFFSQVYKNTLIKKEVIEKDPDETGYRRILNLGHTIGHAIETVENYQIAHGEAIAIGMIVESLISHEMGFLTAKDFESIYQIFRSYSFHLKLSKEISEERIEEFLTLDKKAAQKRARFVLLKKIGEVLPFEENYCTHVDSALLRKALVWMLKEFRE
jgi:3-dehydroquinate synthase